MDSPKYLIIITLIDGQNFNVPDGAPDKIEASVFAEARFGNESILTSDPIKLINSNPEFVTELAWQLDKRSLHQLRVERRAIKLQIFLQTREKTKSNRHYNEQTTSNGFQSKESNATHKVELIGYTVIDIRSAQETEQPKFQWLPLLNPKFRKSSYNRPEVQLALTLSRISETNKESEPSSSSSKFPQHDMKKKLLECSHYCSDVSGENIDDKLDEEDTFYKTCVDFTLDSNEVGKDEILENDIAIRARDGNFYIYDACDSVKSTIDDCDEAYKVTITIPFRSNLEVLTKETAGRYYFSISLFGSSLKTDKFSDLTSVDTKDLEFQIFTTHSNILATYFELNPNLVIKLHQDTGEPLGLATIKLDQLCSVDMKRRSIEGIFAIQSITDNEFSKAIHPTVGVSVVLEKSGEENQQQVLLADRHIELAKEHFGDDIDDYLAKTFDDTHHLTSEPTKYQLDDTTYPIELEVRSQDLIAKQEDHHFRFIIDLKSFTYNVNQRLIPTLRELIVRYSYPFFGYEDSFTTDASIPISSTKSIIVNGFFELNFATTALSLLAAFQETPLDLDILKCDETKRSELGLGQPNNLVATSSLNLAETLNLNNYNLANLQEASVSTTVSPPILDLDGTEIGEVQIFLCLEDLGRPKVQSSKPSPELVGTGINRVEEKLTTGTTSIDNRKLSDFIAEAKSNLETWKEDCLIKLTDDIRSREVERFRRIHQRLEAKEARREQEFKKKMDDLINLERKFKNSLAHIESLERRLSNNFEQLRTKDALLDTRLDTFDLKISKAINNIKLEYEKRLDSLPAKLHRSLDDDSTESKESVPQKIPTRSYADNIQARRSSLKHPISVGIPVPVRSSSLVRGPIEGSSTRIVKRPTGVVTTVVNGVSSRPRSNSNRLHLSKETQEKLASLRKEKAELLKRGCKPNDELILEINSIIEKLAC